MSNEPLAIIFVSNGPGELATWVKPLAKELHKEIALRPRAQASSISLNLVLVPCPNATGNEDLVARKWVQFENIIKAKKFWELLIKPKKFVSWPVAFGHGTNTRFNDIEDVFSVGLSEICL